MNFYYLVARGNIFKWLSLSVLTSVDCVSFQSLVRSCQSLVFADSISVFGFSMLGIFSPSFFVSYSSIFVLRFHSFSLPFVLGCTLFVINSDHWIFGFLHSLILQFLCCCTFESCDIWQQLSIFGPLSSWIKYWISWVLGFLDFWFLDFFFFIPSSVFLLPSFFLLCFLDLWTLVFLNPWVLGFFN